ncbi:MAG TPA: HEAT repeat domain-containing protein [Terriglobia bacterium]|nr:HEAT repeat domain-containing protein [Terriglobia bacterium]
MKAESVALAIADRLFAWAVLLMLAFVSQPVLSSGYSLQESISDSGSVSSQKAPKGNGIVVGIVINERHEPVANAIVQAFSADDPRQPQARESVQRLKHTSGSASTDAEGRFRISGLPLGEYLIAAAPAPLFPNGGPVPAHLYGTTFYPSTLDDQQAVSVSAFSYPATMVEIELVPVRGVRISGSAVSSSGRPTDGLGVKLFHRVGDFGAESNVAVVGAQGTFEIPRVPPGWYRLTVGQATSQSGADGEFADRLIEVRDRDLDGLALVLGPGASIVGRIVAEPGTSVRSSVGLRVSASVTPEQFSASRPITATVADNWSFRMTGLSGSYQFTVSADRAPALMATRITVDGVQVSAGAGVEVAEGAHEVVLFVAPRESPKPAVDSTLSARALVEHFKSEKVFWRQFAIAKEIVGRHDASVLPSLVDWLSHEDRHIRGNVAFIFGGLGDARGLQVITDILTDRSERAEGQGGPPASGDGRYHVARQIAADRYYAAHLLGDLRDPQAIPVLVPLLKDAEINSIVPWSLEQIGDQRAVGALLDALDDESPTMRVLTIYALEALHAKEALPRLISLLNDGRKSNFGAQVSVSDAAKAAIAKLQ